MNKEINNEKLMIMSLLVLCLCLFFSNLAFAQASPLGVEGRVFDSDGYTEVFEGIPVVITNLDTGKFVVGETGKGSTGRFSFVLNWEKGSHINISVSNPFYTSYINTTLSGSIRELELLLNMDFENVPPEFVSSPPIDAVAENNYTYLVEAFDWNNNVVSFSLVEGPDNMTLNDDLISWTPRRGQHGIHNVVINASDGLNYSLQEFELEVFVINDAPNITSSPKTSVIRGDLYKYEVDVVDEDFEFLEYTVFRGPSGMFFDDNVLTFKMNSSHSGEYVVIIDIKDRFGEVGRQIFLLMIDEPVSRSRRSGRVLEVVDEKEEFSIIENGVLSLNGSSSFYVNKFFDDGFVVDKVFIDNSDFLNLKFKETSPLNARVKSIDTRAYKYFSITPDRVVLDDVRIEFFVSEEWLNSTGLSASDVVLVKYDDGWVELDTLFLQKKSDKYLFEAISSGLSLFAITHKEGSVIFERPFVINEINVTRLVHGRIFIVDEFNDEIRISSKQAKELQEDLSLKLVNKKTGGGEYLEIFSLEDYLFFRRNIFEDDDFLLELSYKENVLISKDVLLDDFVNEVNLFLNKNRVEEVFKKPVLSNGLFVFIVVLLLIFLCIFLFIKLKGVRK